MPVRKYTAKFKISVHPAIVKWVDTQVEWDDTDKSPWRDDLGNAVVVPLPGVTKNTLLIEDGLNGDDFWEEDKKAFEALMKAAAKKFQVDEPTFSETEG